MELVRRYLVQIKSQLMGLTISQKLLIGLLGVVMIATIFFTVIWSAKPQMVPVIPQAMSPEDINKVEMYLKGKHEYQVSGDKILVPVESAYAIRGELMAADALPHDLATAFASMIRESSPFTTDAMNTRAWNNALQIELTRWLRSFPYVSTGTVIINTGQQSSLGRKAIPSTASVAIQTRDGKDISSAQLLCIVDFVSGTVPGLNRENVHVVVNGQRAYRGPDANTGTPSNMLESKKEIEGELEGKLFRMFASMGDVKIAVFAMPDLSLRERVTTSYNNNGTVVKPLQESSKEQMSSDATGGAVGEPGMGSNVTASVNDAPASGRKNSSSTSDNNTQNLVKVGETHLVEKLPPGVEWKQVTASISLPRSYFVSIFRRRANDPKAEPDDAKLQPIADEQLKSALALAKNIIGVKADDQVRVDWYDDTIVSNAPDVIVASAGFAGGLSNVSQYAKQGVLFLIALGAMGTMLMMVRKAVPAGADDVDTGVFFGGGKKGKKKGPSVEQLDAIDDVFGEANQGEAVLTGIELDDETLASRKMVDEVSTMIKENPENAASLVKRWMTKSK